MPTIKVAIVEDKENIRNGIAFMLGSSDAFKCTGAYPDAEIAIAEIEKNLPDIVLMDIQLPGMSGIECTKILKAKYHQLQIMMCTVYEDDEKIFDALKAGASGYVLKKATLPQLLDSIKELHEGGSPMSSQIARKVVNHLHQPKPPSADDSYMLSQREKEILNLLSQGYRNKEIAEKINLTIHTVRTHIYNIYHKLHVESRVQAINKLSSDGK